MIFIILVIFITIFRFIKQSGDADKNKKFFLILSLAMIGFLIAFRGISVGADTWNYRDSYIKYSNLSLNEFENIDIEIGYLILIKILNIFSSNPQTMFIFEGFLVAISYGYFIHRNTTTITQAYIAVLGYLAFNLFSFQLSGFRQSIAMCICLWSFEFIKSKKIIPFVLTTLFASAFHASAILFIPSYFVSKFNYNWKTKIIFIFLGFLLLININQLITLVYNVSDRFTKYGIEETGNGNVFFFIMFGIFIFTEVNFKSLLSHYKKNGGILDNFLCWYNINYICFILWCMRLITRTAERPSLYYIPATIILISNFISVFDIESKKVFTFMISILLIILFLYRMSDITYVFCW
ncbi:EpsG family protein [Thomasclavelia sp.]